MLWGLCVDGLPVTLNDQDLYQGQNKALMYELLGFDGRIKVSSHIAYIWGIAGKCVWCACTLACYDVYLNIAHRIAFCRHLWESVLSILVGLRARYRADGII